jgi:hypothetical protein
MSPIALAQIRPILEAYPLLIDVGLSGTDLQIAGTFMQESLGNERDYDGLYANNPLDRIRAEMTPGTILPMLYQADDTASATLLSLVIAERLRESSVSDPALHRAYSVAAALAVVVISADDRFNPGQRASFATRVLQASFSDSPDAVLRLLETTPQLTGRPQDPDASFAYVYRMLMDLYVVRRDAAGFEAAAEQWIETDWPQRDADREWRAKKVTLLRQKLAVP